MRVAVDWTMLIPPSERLMWQGRPDKAWVPTTDTALATALAAFLAFGSVLAAPESSTSAHPLAVLGLVAGICGVIWLLLRDVVQRSVAHYAISDVAIYMAQGVDSDSAVVRRFPISGVFDYILDEEPKASSLIGSELISTRDGQEYEKRLRRQRLEDGPRVHALLLKLQREIRARAQ